jgi:enoyl-[acyl-carrier protein] reductase II
MLRTELCELLGIGVPVIQAAIPPGAGPELAAAVGEAGAIGSLATVFKPADEVSGEIEAVRRLSDGPFIVNHVAPLLDEDAFAATLAARTPVVSMALGDPGYRVEQVHEAGALFIQQVHTVEQARAVAAKGVDAIIAQGSEAGGNCGSVAGSVLVPQVVDEVAPIPVIAAGGIADGRGLAAALALGAKGANVGTRFLASEEAAADPGWKSEIVSAESERAVRLDFWAEIFGTPGGDAYDVAPRSLRTAFADEWLAKPQEAAQRAEELRALIVGKLRDNTIHELAPFTGQTAGLIDRVQPAAEIVARLVEEAERALRDAGRLVA